MMGAEEATYFVVERGYTFVARKGRFNQVTVFFHCCDLLWADFKVAEIVETTVVRINFYKFNSLSRHH